MSKASEAVELDVGIGATVVALDAPGIDLAHDFADESEGKATGTLTAMTYRVAFSCFFCAYAGDNLVDGVRPASHTAVAFASFDWEVHGVATGYPGTPTLTRADATRGLLAVFDGMDAEAAGCETRGPGSLIVMRLVLDY